MWCALTSLNRLGSASAQADGAIIVSAAIGVIFTVQSLGASGYPLITIEVITSLVAALIIGGALR